MGRDTVPGLGARLRQFRDAAGLTQVALAERAGTHPTTVVKIERDERACSFLLAIKLADALGVSVADIAGRKKGKRK